MMKREPACQHLNGTLIVGGDGDIHVAQLGVAPHCCAGLAAHSPQSPFWTNCTETQSARTRACCPMSSKHVQRGTTFAAGICGVKRQPEPLENEGPQQLWLHFELCRRSAVQNFAGAGLSLR